MFGGARIAVVVPARDEAKHISRALRAIPELVDLVVIVDDGSRDSTGELAREEARRDERLLVLAHPQSRGVGAALATGYGAAFAAGADVAVVMAGDAQMDPADLPALLHPVVAGEVEYAKGDRLGWPGAWRLMPWTRYVGCHLFSLLTRLATGLAIRDSQCGYTALSRRGAEAIGVESLWPGYGYPNDLLGRLARAGLAVHDVQVRPVYADERSGLGMRHVLFTIPSILLRSLALRAIGSGATRTAALYRQSRPT